MHRVQTRFRVVLPLSSVVRICCRFGSQIFRDLLLAWLTWWPSCRPFPQISQTRDINLSPVDPTEKSGAKYAKETGGLQAAFFRGILAATKAL
jgi:hypothetical protein